MARVRAVGVCGLIFCGTPTGGVGARGPMRGRGRGRPHGATEVEGHGGRNLDWVRGVEMRDISLVGSSVEVTGTVS